MSQTDVKYYRERAASEREMARNCTTPEVAAIHAELARGYDVLASPPEKRRRSFRAV